MWSTHVAILDKGSQQHQGAIYPYASLPYNLPDITSKPYTPDRPPAPSPNVMSTADPPPPDLAPDPLIILDATTAPISTHNLQTRTLNLLIHRRLSRHLPNELVLAILDHAHTYLMLPPISK